MDLAALARRVSQWSDRRFTAVLACVVLALRLSHLDRPLFPDEAGYLLVARSWHLGGPNLYGHYFVDRPPLLIAVYGIAALTGWAPFVRVLGAGFAVVMVVSAAWAAGTVGGARGVRWAAVTAAALVVTPLLSFQEADGEVFAAPVVMLAVALLLSAVRHESVLRSALGGLAAGCAVLVKQSFADAVVFGAVLLVASVWQRRVPLAAGLRLVLGAVVGGTVSLAGAAAYVVLSRVGFADAWASLFGFRTKALDVIEDHSLHSALVRASELVGLSLLSGLLPLVLLLLLGGVRARFRGSPVAWAVGGTLLYDVVAVALGGSYWPHYLLQLAPMAALAAGVWAPTTRRLRAGVALTVASALAASGVLVLTSARFPVRAQDVGAWVRASARPGDTATVLFGHADVQVATGLPSPYEHLWTLPMRAFDPHLAHLRRLVDGRRAPTWLVAWESLDPWDMDVHGRFRAAVAKHYRPVADVCGHLVYLHDGVHRHLAPPSRSCRG